MFHVFLVFGERTHCIHALGLRCNQTYRGPPPIFDHQMVMDSDAQMLYVFGGKVVDEEKSPFKYSGLYSLDVQTKQWTHLQ